MLWLRSILLKYVLHMRIHTRGCHPITPTFHKKHACLHLVWNIVVTQIVYAIHSIEKKVMKRRIKESPWRSRKIVFRLTVS